jgi:hypothetical protein
MEDYFKNLEEKIERDSSFSKEEVDVLKSVIRVYRGILGVKIIGSWMIALLVAFSAVLVSWSSILERLDK